MTEAIVALIALTLMEIVLGIDNIVFISILTSKLPEHQRAKGRTIGLAAALITRVLLLFSINWIMKLKMVAFSLSTFGLTFWVDHQEVNEVTYKDLVLLAGGLFLIGKSVQEIHNKFGEHEEHHKTNAKAVSFKNVIIQIAILDIVFSLDSVITAVGMADEIWVMVTAVIIAIGVMMVFSGSISRFVHDHPTVKMLALSFLILIGVMLVAGGVGTEIDKGYIYFAMAFALLVEMLNLKLRSRGKVTTMKAEEPSA